MSPDRPGTAIGLQQLVWLLAGLVLAGAPHATRIPWWVAGTAAMLLLWRLYIGWRQTPLPNRWLLLAVAAGDLVGVYFTYRTIFGRDAGVTLLVLLLSLKLLEMRERRDVFVVIFLAYFVALTNFFYSQTIPIAGLMLLTVLVITAALVGINAMARPMLENLKTSSVMLVQAMPVMLLLFFLFPRVQGPMWGLPQDAFAGISGLSDTMSPGAISRLSQSDAIAFRVRFNGSAPTRSQLYWRGPVMWDFDGRTWRPGSMRLRPDIVFEGTGDPVDYEVTLEPHNRNWLFVLDLPGRVPPNARVTADYQIISLPPVRNRMRYDMRSYPSYRATGGGEREDLRAALALPAEINPRARALAREWRAQSGDDTAIMRRAMSWLRSGGFEYTLQPPLLGLHGIDEFLFLTKQGFCEHYSAAFVFLMRAAGVPARVVTGYQGGEVNPVDGYMVVRQADAHAWAEVWLGDRGWVRTDPTAAVAPVRLENGIAAAMPASTILPLMIRADISWLITLRNNWEALANRWNQWVLGYNPERQRDLLNWLGVQQPNWHMMAMLLFWSIAAVLLATAIWLLGEVRRHDAVQRAWLRFCAKLRRAGLERSQAEGPMDYARRVGERLPERRGAVSDIARLYIDLRYGSRADRQSVFRLKQLVREFSA